MLANADASSRHALASTTAAQVVNRAAVKHSGRTMYEYITGHQTKAPLVCFGDAQYWREKRTADALNMYDSKIFDGNGLGISGCNNAVMVGTQSGVVRTRDIRRLPEGERWNKK